MEESKAFVNEESVETVYRKYANFCVVLAATLEFHLPEWGKGCLEWEKKNSSPSGYSNAIADGYLQINDTAAGDKPQQAGMKMAQVFHTFRDIANWEFKSLKAGSLGVMEAVMELSKKTESNDGPFPWTGCVYGEDCFYMCSTPGESNLAHRQGARNGNDALIPLVQLDGGDGPSVWGNPSTTAKEVGSKTHAKHMVQQVSNTSIETLKLFTNFFTLLYSCGHNSLTMIPPSRC